MPVASRVSGGPALNVRLSRTAQGLALRGGSHPAGHSHPSGQSGSPGSPSSTGTSGLAQRIGQQLGERIGTRKFGLWFDRQTTRLRVEGGSLLVDLATPYVAEWIGRHFSTELNEAARSALGPTATVLLRVSPEVFGRTDEEQTSFAEGAFDGRAGGALTSRPDARTDSRSDSAQGPGSQAGHSSLSDSRPNRRGAFDPDRVTLLPPPLRRGGGEGRRITLRKLDEFVSGPSNQLAFDAARRLAEFAPGATHLLFVHGDCGVGKTHLLQGICDRRRAMAPRAHVRYTTAEQFTNEYLAALRDGSLEAFRKSLRRLDLLAIDDIHFLSNKTATQSEFLHTMDAIDLSGARIVLASDEHPRQIKKFSQSLVSRFLSGMVVRIDRPDRQTRISLVRRLARDRGITLQPAAEEIVANRCVGSVREIEGALARLLAFASLVGPTACSNAGAEMSARMTSEQEEGGEISGATDSFEGGDRQGGRLVEIGALVAERAFEDETASRPSGPIRIGEIVERVSQRLGVDREEVLGSGRHRRVVLARSVVVFLARELTTQSFPEIARALGRDTHSTAHTAAKRIEQMLAAGERVEVGDPTMAGPDGMTPLTELLAQLRHDVLRSAPRS
jgi:chromosomal replication initiator protein